jgi:hypothetical protein
MQTSWLSMYVMILAEHVCNDANRLVMDAKKAAKATKAMEATTSPHPALRGCHGGFLFDELPKIYSQHSENILPAHLYNYQCLSSLSSVLITAACRWLVSA